MARRQARAESLMPKSVLLLGSSASLYGADRMLRSSVRALMADGFSAFVALPEHGPLEGWLSDLGASVDVLSDYVLRRLNASPRGLAQLGINCAQAAGVLQDTVLSNSVPDLVYSNTLAVPFGAIISRRIGRPHLWHSHEIISQTGLAIALRLVGAATNSYYVTNSRATQSQRAVGRRSVIIGNFASEELLQLGRLRQLEQEKGTHHRTVRVVVPGRIRASKGQHIGLAAYQHLVRRGYDIEMTFIGEAAPGAEGEYEAIANRAAELGVGVLAPTTAQSDLYANADLVLIPSVHPEGFSLVAAEAMAASLPVIAFGIGGIQDVVRSGMDGVLVDPNEGAVGLARSIEVLLRDPAQRVAMGVSGHRRAAKSLTEERYCRAIQIAASECIRRS